MGEVADLALAEGVGLEEVVIRVDSAPDQSTYDPSDLQLRDAAQMLQVYPAVNPDLTTLPCACSGQRLC